MVRCRDDSLYTGWTTDLDARIREHNAGRGSKYTRARGPVRLVYKEECKDKSTALKREAEIKKFSREQKIELINVNEKS